MTLTSAPAALGVFDQPDTGGHATEGVKYVIAFHPTQSFTVTVTFPAPVTAFGFDVTDYESGPANPLVFSYAGGSFPAAIGSTNGGGEFFGIIDTDQPFSSCSLIHPTAPAAIGDGWTLDNLAVALPCGNGVVDAGEECDDGQSNGTLSSCCAANCQFQTVQTACTADGDLCTNDVCDGAGHCTHPFQPDGGCITPATAGARLAVTSKPAPTPDQVKFKWAKGPSVPLSDFGTPGTGTDYALCIYDGSPGGGFVDAYHGEPSGAWLAKPTGWKFKSKDGLPDGITGVVLKASAIPLKAKIQFKAKGALAVEDPPFMITPNVVAQVRTSTGRCWGASFSSATRNAAGKFKAKSD